MPDPELARRLGRTRSAVQLKRHRRGIRMFHYVPRWKPEEVALLGKVSDEEVARRTGRSLVAIKAKRLKDTNVRFPTHTPSWPLSRWTETNKALLRESKGSVLGIGIWTPHRGSSGPVIWHAAE